MTKAEHDHTTHPAPRPSRRGLLAGSMAALLAAGAAFVTAARAAPAAGAVATGDDAELVRLQCALAAQREVVDRILAEDRLPDGITPASRDHERRLDDACVAWEEILEDITDTPARTAAGMRIKAAVMSTVLTHFVCYHNDQDLDDIATGEVGGIEDRLALSIARDLLDGEALA